MRGMAVAVAPHPYHSSLNLSAWAALVPVVLWPTLAAHLSPHLPHSAALVAVVVALLPTPGGSSVSSSGSLCCAGGGCGGSITHSGGSSVSSSGSVGGS